MKSVETSRKLDPDTTNIFDSNEVTKGIDSIRNPTLDNTDLKEIENEIIEASLYFQKVLEDKDIENRGLVIPVLFSVCLVIFLLEIFKVPNFYNLKSITSSMMSTDENGMELKSIQDIDSFIRDKVFNYFLSNSSSHPFIALAGLKLTLKKSIIVKNPHPGFEYPEFVSEPYDYQRVYEKPNERNSKFGIWNYNSGHQGFIEYFLGDSLQESLIRWREMKSFWLDAEGFISLDIDLVSHCRNTFTTSYFSKKISVKTSGKIESEEFSQGFSPEVYSFKGHRFTSIITMFTLLMILYIVQLLQFLRSYGKICKRFISKFELNLNLYDYLEVIFICCLTTTIALFIKLDLANIGEFSMPLNRESFDSLLNHLSEYRHLIRSSSLTCLFSIIRLVALMKIQFPSFGVLFETIQFAKNDMINICFISIVLFFGFFISGHIAYGVQAEEFSSLSFAAMEYFRSMTGNVTIFYCTEASCYVITIITMLFMILFYFVLINLFYAVIMSTFYMLKSKDRLLIAAKTEIVMERTKEFFKILAEFLKFNKRSMLYKEANEYIKLSEANSTCMTIESREKLQNIENFIKGHMSIGLIQKIKFNISSLRIFLYESKLVNQEFYIENFKKKIRKILTEEKIEEKVHQLREFDVEYNFRLIRGLFCYVLLIFFFLLTIFSFFSIKSSYEISKINKECATRFIVEENSFESLKDINTLKHIYNSSELLITSLLSSQCNFQEYLDLNNSIRLTIQLYTYEKNPSTFSNSLLSKYTSGELNFSVFRGKKTQLLYNQYPEGSQNTYKLGGGLSYTYNELDLFKSLVDYIKIDEILNNCKLFAIEWVTVNPNSNFITYNSALFKIGVDELITTEIDSVSISNYFHSNDSKSVIFLIVISLILCCYFFIANLIDLGHLWKKVNKTRIINKRKNFELDRIIDQICGSKQRDFNSLAGAYFSSKIKKFIKGLFEHSFQLGKVIFIYFLTDPFNLLEATSIILTFVTLINLLYVSVYSFEINDVSEAAIAAAYVKYFRTFAALNSMILLIQFPAYLQIFSRISYLIRIIISAKLDFIFFMVMYFMILFSFVFSGYILMGHYNSGYSTIPMSLFSCYFMQFGQYDQKDYLEADNYLGIPFIFLYVIVIMIFLATMFTAIFSGNYQEDIHIYKMSTFEKIKKTLRSRWQGKKVIQIVVNQEEDQEIPTSSIDRIVISNAVAEVMNLEETFKQTIDKVTYFSALQNQLKLKNIKLTVTDSKTKFKRKYSKPRMLPYVNQQIWKESLIEDKVEIWNGLSIQYNDQLLSNKDYFPGSDKISSNCDFSDIQKVLWNSLTLNEKIAIWKEDLSNEGRVFIWNIEENSENHFEGWETMSTEEKIEKTKEFIGSKGTKQELWKSLPRYSIVKLNLLLSLRENLQNEIVMFLCMLDAVDSPIFIEMIDQNLEEILNNAIFDTKLKMCEYYGEKRKYENIQDLKFSVLKECNSLIDYKDYLNSRLLGHRKNIKIRHNKNDH